MNNEQAVETVWALGSVSPRDLGATWYRGDIFEGADKVTSASSNKALGIDRIAIFPAQNGPKNGYLGNANITMLGGNVSFGGAIYLTEQGTLRFQPYQRTYTDEKGKTQYADMVHTSLAVAAQVLRRAESLMVKIEKPKPVAQKAPVATAGQFVQQFANQAADPTVNIGDDDLPF